VSSVPTQEPPAIKAPCSHGLRRRIIDSDELEPKPCTECESEEYLAGFGQRRFQSLNRQKARAKYESMSFSQRRARLGTKEGDRYEHKKRKTVHSVDRLGDDHVYLRRVDPLGKRCVLVPVEKLKTQYTRVVDLMDELKKGLEEEHERREGLQNADGSGVEVGEPDQGGSGAGEPAGARSSDGGEQQPRPGVAVDGDRQDAPPAGVHGAGEGSGPADDVLKPQGGNGVSTGLTWEADQTHVPVHYRRPAVWAVLVAEAKREKLWFKGGTVYGGDGVWVPLIDWAPKALERAEARRLREAGNELLALFDSGGVLVHEGREPWLESRKSYIGGSGVAKVMLDNNNEALSKYGGPFKVYVERKGTPDLDPYVERHTLFSRMEIGQKIEPFVASLAMEALNGREIRMMTHTIVVDRVAPHLGVTPDAIFLEPDPDPRLRRWAGLECKNSGMSGDNWPKTDGEIVDIEPGADSGLPVDYEIQCQACMAVTGFDTWYLAAFLWGNDLRIWRLKRDENVISWMREHVEGFWRTHIEPEVPPPMSIRDLHPEKLAERIVGTQDDGSTVHLDYEQFAHWAKAAHEAGRKRKEAETTEKFAKAQLLLGMGEAEKATCARYKVTAKTNKWGHRQMRVTPEKNR